MAQTGKGQHKAGRNKLACTRYRNEMRREKNKARRLRRHILRYAQHGMGDKTALAAYKALPTQAHAKYPL